MTSRIPVLIRPTLEEYLALVKQELPDLRCGFYLIGSIALGEFNERFSDIDFCAVLSRRAHSLDIENLRKVHRVIGNKYPTWKMSGIYLQPEDLGQFKEQVTAYPCCDEGKLVPAGYFELNSVTWWELKNRGVALKGPEPRDLPFTVDWNLLVANMRENLNTYWASWTRRPGRVLAMLSDWGIQWAVLGVLRQFYSFRENSITAKVKAGEYALGCLPTRWHRLIQEAINIRAGKKPSAYRFRIARTIEAVSFLKYIIHSCNDGFE